MSSRVFAVVFIWYLPPEDPPVKTDRGPDGAKYRLIIIEGYKTTSFVTVGFGI